MLWPLFSVESQKQFISNISFRFHSRFRIPSNLELVLLMLPFILELYLMCPLVLTLVIIDITYVEMV